MTDMMDDYTATMIAEGVEEADEKTKVAAWQHLINSGLCWSLQGWFGRRACEMIANNICKTTNAAPIPARAQSLIQRIQNNG